MTNSDFLTEGYPETPHPAWGHPLYNLAAHLFNAISNAKATAEWNYWFPLELRSMAARKATTVAVYYLRRSLIQAENAIVDLPPVEADRGEEYRQGYRDAQGDALYAVQELRKAVLADLQPVADALVPDIAEVQS